MYSTLLQRISTSPRLPENWPSIHSSVLIRCNNVLYLRGVPEEDEGS